MPAANRSDTKDSFAVQRLLATSTTNVTVVPHYTSSSPPSLLSGRIPALTASLPATVPLWAALSLKRMGLCTIVPPKWLTILNLRAVVRWEKDVDKESFVGEEPEEEGGARLPRHWQEIGGLITQAQDWEERDGVRSLLEDVRNLREEKMRQSLHTISRTAMAPPVEAEDGLTPEAAPIPVLDVTGIGSVEIASVRPFVREAFGTHLKYVLAGTERGEGRVVGRATATGRRRTDLRGAISQVAVSGENEGDNGLERPRPLTEDETRGDSVLAGEKITNPSSSIRSGSRLRRFRS
uniref:DNA replication complex GINS protein PSF2 N-terminal domain-containing protein n=1 Tax=Corethron hystrix TaxID=216773 RepID=A0A6U5DNM4_9STRA|mmetsp:Transcript_12862/g.28392  ORF Transcript_12862/g.28392 Transcript_12862/m.28392 type:complete len:294 (+) Transcript_12862:32-913(+)|eukprot:CAMPEP_0113298260 /NCGR_PEP_ID=MMETSP0010_2-20120614/781_1 /TAXON_ID=216773 ORGANISM="Corethron hystrix, Strain 308" /NCGR_SAMPLE_ID=MMETSP0010_2 /ASSEMBLY_ACC=CAM_ASM_000155 /LENGTH=293 /DNA_ID=CAMNT_0000151289 /DNA_START=32 /DNA_END=913 /DNA_ORIENTATION=+ /assembly_acc=CAM_ASM_000155